MFIHFTLYATPHSVSWANMAYKHSGNREYQWYLVHLIRLWNALHKQQLYQKWVLMLIAYGVTLIINARYDYFLSIVTE